MDPVLQQIYSLVVPSLPYVIGAYAVLWVGLMVYVSLVLLRLGRLERQLALVEEIVAKRS
jgi:CcmD family protein